MSDPEHGPDDVSSVHADSPAARSAAHSRIVAIGQIALFDVGGPIIAYYLLKGSGLSTVAALVASGTLPAAGAGIALATKRRIDALGAVVLVGIMVGAIAGLATGSAHLVLLDGTVPTFVFGAACVGSLWTARPLIYRFALEAMGPGSPKGRDFAGHWRYPGFRHAFRVITAVRGLAFIAEAAVQVVIIENAPAGVAKTTANLMPVGFAAVLVAWNVAYGKRSQRRGELAARAAASPDARP